VSVTLASSASLAGSFREWKEQVMALTDGWGVDVAVEAVAVPPTLEMYTEIVRPGGAWPRSGARKAGGPGRVRLVL